MPFRPGVPRRNNQYKNYQVIPAQQAAKAHAGFSIEYREQKKNRRWIHDTEQTFGQTGKGRANPKASKPGSPMTATLIAAQSGEDCARNKCAHKRFGHYDAREQKCATETEINQTGDEAAPVISEPFPNQKNQGNGGNNCKRNRESGGGRIDAKDLERNNDEPIEQWRFLQARCDIVGGQKPLMGFDHLPCCSLSLP